MLPALNSTNCTMIQRRASSIKIKENPYSLNFQHSLYNVSSLAGYEVVLGLLLLLLFT